MRAAVSGLVILFALAAQASGQLSTQAATSQGANAWYELPILGTPAGLALAAGLQRDAAGPDRVVPEIIRTVHQVVGEQDPILDRVSRYLVSLERLQAALRALGEAPVSLRLAENDEQRRRLDALVTSIGLNLNYRKGSPPRVSRAVDPGAADFLESLAEAGIDLEGIEDRLNRGETLSIALPTTVVPLPMTFEWWRQHVAIAQLLPPEHLLRGILADEEASFLYHGLLSLDGPTREYLTATPKLVNVLKDNPALFAAYGGSLRVRNGAIDVPGGGQAIPFWEAVVGENVSRPERFINAVLSSDSGRMAYFYDLIAHLDPPRIKFALSLSSTTDRRSIRQRVDALYGWFNVPSPRWNPTRRPFTRPPFDPALLFVAAAVDVEGKPLAPAWPYLWRAIFDRDDIPDQPEKQLKPAGGTADAPLWIEQVFGKANPHERLDTLLFAQRVFHSAPEAAAPDMLVALRGFRRFSALCLTLERTGVRDPRMYALAVRHASALSAISDRDQAVSSVSQLQGALAILEYATRKARLSPQQATFLLTSLFDVRLERQGSYGAGIAVWIDQQLKPAVAARRVDGEMTTDERLLLAGVVGLPTVILLDAPGALVEWEGWQYQVHSAPAVFENVMKVRARQGGNAVDPILKLARASAALESVTGHLDLPAEVDVLKALQKELKEPPRAADEAPLRVQRVLGDAVRDLERISASNQVQNVNRVAQELNVIVAGLTADWLRAVTYALNITDPETPLLLGGDVSWKHDLGLSLPDQEARDQTAWGLPQESNDDGIWHVKGSLLALDLALVSVTLHRVTTGLPTEAPVWGLEDIKAFQRLVPLFNPLKATDAVTIATAIEKGRERVEQLSRNREDFEAIAGAVNLGPLRRSLLTWNLEHNAAGIMASFSLSDLLRIGGDSEAIRLAEEWGAPALPLNGCLCLSLGPAIDWEVFAGRGAANGYLAAHSPDLLLRLAEFMAELKLPAAVASDILPVAMQSAFFAARLS